ncbi:hypothetical protein LUZ61_002329 [Rhynchospora tenuis]|uniref:Phytocyanin domain-containing protein n=1 Tax=Rhynchospora tenuis TaxID=198213 RepID=A0AAD5ZJ63_9POAL|nr:hypothetical protein LUZ61_002329 [Rhynchospora tenuis]
MTKFKVSVAFTLLAVTLQFAFAVGTNYTVGAPGGLWDLSTNYTKWASNITFYPGDNLLFKYTLAHDVWEVTEADYTSCTKGTPLKQYKDGNTLIALTEAGSRYFYCSVSSHCSSGMKLEVSVVPTDSSPPPSPPPPNGTTPDSPPPPKGAAAANSIWTRSAIAPVLGAILMIFL